MAQTFRVRWEISLSLRTHPRFFAAVAHNVSVQRFLRAQLPRTPHSTFKFWLEAKGSGEKKRKMGKEKGVGKPAPNFFRNFPLRPFSTWP